MIVPERNSPISIHNFAISMNNGEKKWASLCLVPTDAEFCCVWKLVLCASILPSNDTVRQIIYDLSDTQKLFFIRPTGPVQGVFTWNGEVWDASLYVSCTYDETTAIMELSWVIPFCPTFTKPSLVFFDIYIHSK